MRRLRALGLDEVLRERAAAGVPLLGICLGMQLLFERSTEHEGAAGLGLLPREVTGWRRRGKLPHIGWNLVTFERAARADRGLGEAAAFYHVHSFACRPATRPTWSAAASTASASSSIVERGSVFGAQFHPEKSSLDGLALLRNFARLCARVAA